MSDEILAQVQALTDEYHAKITRLVGRDRAIAPAGPFERTYTQMCPSFALRTKQLINTLTTLRAYLALDHVKPARALIDNELYNLRAVADPGTDHSDRYVCLFNPDAGRDEWFNTESGTFTGAPCIFLPV